MISIENRPMTANERGEIQGLIEAIHTSESNVLEFIYKGFWLVYLMGFCGIGGAFLYSLLTGSVVELWKAIPGAILGVLIWHKLVNSRSISPSARTPHPRMPKNSMVEVLHCTASDIAVLGEIDEEEYFVYLFWCFQIDRNRILILSADDAKLDSEEEYDRFPTREFDIVMLSDSNVVLDIHLKGDHYEAKKIVSTINGDELSFLHSGMLIDGNIGELEQAIRHAKQCKKQSVRNKCAADTPRAKL